MKLAAIYNVFDGIELLRGSIDSIKKHIDKIIVVYQSQSNFGEVDSDVYFKILNCIAGLRTACWYSSHYQPIISLGGSINERNKRNIGIEIARKLECTHFFHIDVDEYYEDFGAAKKQYIDSGADGSVCPIYTYFKKPTLRLAELDSYYVPFIHKLHPGSKAGSSSYPYWVDPTRTINVPEGERVHLLADHPMHHYSWVRKDIERKARNSSAGQHGNKLAGLLADYHSPDLGEGYVIKDMGGQKLVTVPNIFGIPEF